MSPAIFFGKTSSETGNSGCRGQSGSSPFRTTFADIAHAQTKTELMGFVSVDIDFSAYQTAFSKNLALASFALIALLFISWIVGHAMLKRALRPLSELQEPLSQIAQGTMEVTFPVMRHRETQAIVTALGDTLSALQKREQHLMHIADHDAVTGLYSRHRLVSELDAANRAPTNTRSALCSLISTSSVHQTHADIHGRQLLRLARNAAGLCSQR
jgi:methyl-accepting chemotaxis protein